LRPKIQETSVERKKLAFKHDHRQSCWLIAGGSLIWCYQCGAWRVNAAKGEWHYPTGKNGKNPAV
jgi:hypothetical protein